MKSFSEFLLEASLTGNSRSAKTSNWNAYVVNNAAWKTTDYTVETNNNILDESGSTIGSVVSGDIIKILSLDLTIIKRSKFAKVSLEDGTEGFINISAIKKPEGKSNNTKELTPTKLGLKGKKYTLDELVREIPIALNRIQLSDEMKNHMLDCVGSIVNKNLFEEKITFEKTIKLSQKHNLPPAELKVISKNFGEVIGALFLLKTNKRTKYVEFPIGNQGLYDFIEYSNDDRKVYYSIKSGSGSTVSLKNINLFLDFIKLDYPSEDVAKLKTLITSKNKRIIDIIVDYINDFESDIAQYIIKELDISELSHKELSKWKTRSLDLPLEDNIKILKKIYDKIDYKITSKTIITITDLLSAKIDTSDNGLILYPLGSYIVKSLNNNENMLNLLNGVLTLSFISNSVLQSNVDVDNESITVKLVKFKDKQFKYGFASMMSKPGNMPLGFIEI